MYFNPNHAATVELHCGYLLDHFRHHRSNPLKEEKNAATKKNGFYVGLAAVFVLGIVAFSWAQAAARVKKGISF
jgi:hypothetical protein